MANFHKSHLAINGDMKIEIIKTKISRLDILLKYLTEEINNRFINPNQKRASKNHKSLVKSIWIILLVSKDMRPIIKQVIKR